MNKTQCFHILWNIFFFILVFNTIYFNLLKFFSQLSIVCKSIELKRMLLKRYIIIIIIIIIVWFSPVFDVLRGLVCHVSAICELFYGWSTTVYFQRC